jgi:ubiquinone/menaquinone biosynthesis C-methylase UbiE
LTERLGIALRKVPTPAGRAFFGMPTARGVGVAQKLGVFARLAGGAADPDELADELGLQGAPLRMLLELLSGEGLLSLSDGRYALSADGRRWLDPASPTYVGTYVEHSLEYWDWWGRLEEVLSVGGDSMLDHGLPSEDPSWPIYIRGQYELARLSADEVARALKPGADARSVLDVAGGHGWFSAALCKRNPSLRATVLDLPGSVAVGREIIREAGMQEVVRHVEGNMMSSDLGGPHDLVLAFSIVHHLTPGQRDELLGRIHGVLRPGGTLAILDMFRPEANQRPVTSAAVFQLFFHLTSGSDVLSEQELRGHLSRAGFQEPRRTDIRSIPDYRLYTATVR